MNQLSLEKRTQIVQLLVEGNSLRATSRITGCSLNTISKLLIEVGNACRKFHNRVVVNLSSERVQADEIWSFVYSKQKNAPEELKGEVGDCWTFTAIDADTKLIISYYVGLRDTESAETFMMDVSRRLKNRVQISTDGLAAYSGAVRKAFDNDVDFGREIKTFGNAGKGEGKYSPAECTGCERKAIVGAPDKKHISTAFVERNNLTMRMGMRRFTRLTNAFSKKLENHACAISLHFVYYNFCRIHGTLKVTPAMAAGLIDNQMQISDIVKLTEKR